MQNTRIESDKLFRKRYSSIAEMTIYTSAKKLISYVRPSQSVRNIPLELVSKT